MKSGEKQVKQAATAIGANVKEKKLKDIKAGLEEITKKGGAIHNKSGLSDEMVEGIYSQAYVLYNTGKYKEASQIFQMLLMLGPTTPKFSMGLAACFHMLKDYAAAVKIYTILSLIDSKNPIPFYHASDCYLQMKDLLSAVMMLKMAVKASGEKPEFRLLKERSSMMIESLSKEIAEKK